MPYEGMPRGTPVLKKGVENFVLLSLSAVTVKEAEHDQIAHVDVSAQSSLMEDRGTDDCVNLRFWVFKPLPGRCRQFLRQSLDCYSCTVTVALLLSVLSGTLNGLHEEREISPHEWQSQFKLLKVIHRIYDVGCSEIDTTSSISSLPAANQLLSHLSLFAQHY